MLLSVKDLTFAHADDIKRSAKFAARFVGPFAVKSIVNDNAYELDLPPQLRIHPTQNVSKLRRWRASPAAFASRPQPHDRPAPELVDAAGNASYEVERILAQRRVGRNRRRVEFLVKWKGYPNEDSSWAKESELDCPDLLAEFFATQADHRDVDP